RCRCESEEETRRAGRDFSAELRTPVVLSLEGPMGAGKTCFVKGLAEGLGCDPDDVSSPTFTLVHEYGGGRLPLVHMDLYRIEDAAELAALRPSGSLFPSREPPAAFTFWHEDSHHRMFQRGRQHCFHRRWACAEFA
ncbi:tRNA (adenosine(37)-N6)-threonylcarbamoyltransferase complex ATPase subunit type 1 TsaE, partial [bacterium]|nr:tRNA (adenosine(37)-N6)-threonylcarbamoyltransferase complex ATPase subunit type 1 TsaE [bacterium]